MLTWNLIVLHFILQCLIFRKVLKELLLKTYPNVTEEDVSEIFPKKDRVNIVKLVTASNETVQVYTVQNKPMLFCIKNIILPTVYLLWKLPEMIITFTVHRAVLSHINNGADLMIPGVTVPPEKYGFFAVDTPACINEMNNKAALAVGLTTVSSGEMSMNARGKCLAVYHSYGDRLCSLDNYKLEPIPEMGPPTFLQLKTHAVDFPTLEESMGPKENMKDVKENSTENPESISEMLENTQLENSSEANAAENMDDLLLHSFLVVLKYSKSLSLPILTSNFYKQMTVSVPDKVIDVKKSSYKKISQFLQKMCEVGVSCQLPYCGKIKFICCRKGLLLKKKLKKV